MLRPAFLAPLLLSGCITVHPGQGAIRFSPLNDEAPVEVVGPGIYRDGVFHSFSVYDMRWRTVVEEMSVQTMDKLHMSIAASLTFRIREDALFDVDRILGKGFYSSMVKPILLTATRTEFARYPHERVVPDVGELQDRIAASVREQLEPHGIEISRVVLDDIDYPESIASAIAGQMAMRQEIENQDAALELAERKTQVAEEEARGEARVRLVTAEAALEVAQREAEVAVVEAESRAESIRALSTGLTDAYLRLRAIEAAELLAESPNAKIYVVPQGEGGLPYLFLPDAGR